MPTLYYAPGACSLPVHIVLEWIGVPYEAVRVDQHAPEYRRINPAGAVPALRLDDRTVLTQADAILHYLARKHPDAGLLDERTPDTAAELDRWGCFLTGNLHPAFLPVFVPNRYTTSTDPAAREAIVAAGLALVTAKIGLLDAHLAGRDWMVGNHRTILDAYALPMLNWARAKLPDGLAPFATADVYHRRMLDDPIVVDVIARETAKTCRRTHPWSRIFAWTIRKRRELSAERVSLLAG